MKISTSFLAWRTLAIGISLLVQSATGQAQQVPAPAQQVVDSLLRAHRLPALAAAVIEPDRIRYVVGGQRHLD